MGTSDFKCSNIIISYDPGTERDVYARWSFPDKYTKESVLDKFEYAWNYKVTVRKKTRVRKADGTYEDKIEETSEIRLGEEGEIAYKSGVTSFEKSWTPPENTRLVTFKIRAVKKTKKNNDTNTTEPGPWATYVDSNGKQAWFTIGISTLPTQKLADEDVSLRLITSQDRTVAQATWETSHSEGHWSDTYLAGWEYVFRYKKDGTYQEGQSDTIPRDARHIDYQLEPNTSAVKFKIKPVPVAQYFVGGDSQWKEIKIKLTDRKPEHVDINLLAKSDRTYLVEWYFDSETTGITGFNYEWQYLRGSSTNGAWMAVQSGSVEATSYVEEERTVTEEDDKTKKEVQRKHKYKIWSFFIENLDDSAEEIRVRIKPVSNLDQITYKEVWTDWKNQKVTIPPASITDLSLSMVTKSKNTVQAEWNVDKSIKDDVASFTYEWQYKTPGSDWQPGTNGTLDRNTYKDGQDGKPRWYVTYSVPDDTISVRFRANPVPKYTGSFTSPLASFTTLNIEVQKLKVTPYEIIIADPQTGMLRAFWSKNVFTENNELQSKIDVDSYEFEWRYTLRSTTTPQGNTIYIDGPTGSTTNDYTDYTPVDNVATVEFHVKPKAKYDFEFEGVYDYSIYKDGWARFKFSDVPTNNATGIELAFAANEDRKIDATWGVENLYWGGGTSGIELFECVWEYRTKYNGYRYPGKTENITYESFIEWDLVDGVRRGKKWLSYYDYPTNAYQVLFKVRPIPRSQLTFRASYSSEVTFRWENNITKRAVTNLIIKPYNDLVNGEIYAQWNLSNTTNLDGYEIRWMFLIGNDPTDPDAWWYDSTTTEDTIDKRTQPYPIPENSKFVNVEVRPIPLYESSFEGEWARPKDAYFELVAQTTSVNSDNITLNRFSEDSKKLIVSWEYTEFTPVSYDVEWWYYQNGYWLGQTVNSVAYDVDPLQDEYDTPDEAEWVRVRIRPVFDDDPTKDPEWSKYVEYEWDIKANNIINLTIEQDQGTRTMIASWSSTMTKGLDSYEYKWRYMYNYNWFDGQSGSTSGSSPACTYDVPDNSQKVGISVRAVPLSSAYFIGEWSIEEIADAPAVLTPETPQTPTVSIQGFTLTATVDTYDTNTSRIEYEILSDSESGEYVYRTADTPVSFNRSTFSVLVFVGHTYRVRARGLNVEGNPGEWSQYSEGISTIPEGVGSPIDIAGTSATSAKLTWPVALGVSLEDNGKYTVEHAAKESYFETARSQVHSEEVPAPAQGSVVTAEIFNLDYSENGQYFFRIRGENSQGSGEWSDVVSVTVGEVPEAPTTWSSTISATADREVFLFWVHNSKDNSRETMAQLELTVDYTPIVISINGTIGDHLEYGDGTDLLANAPSGSTTTLVIVKDPDDDTTSYYRIPPNLWAAGANIKWRVRTKGAIDEYGEWSVQREINIYAPPTIAIQFTSGIEAGVLRTYPLVIEAATAPLSQTPVGYSVTITSNSSYDAWYDTGVVKPVRVGEIVFSKYYALSDSGAKFTINPGDAALANMMDYTLSVVVSMNSGLTAETSYNFTVLWEDKDYYLSAEIGLRDENISMYIIPYCYDETDALVPDVTLSVYRREFDGTFTLVGDNIINDHVTTIIDPHPALDYARYRIVSRSNTTGLIDYYDVPNFPIGETSIVLQWDETWSSFSRVDEDELADNPHSGSFLKLPFNVKISESNTIDSQLVEYIGRRHPVSYYGTQVGQKLTLNADIAMTDVDTVYALRRLAVWMGDVYVREPSGSGYWAKVEVSFSQTRTEVTIPVTINVTRVEGGV